MYDGHTYKGRPIQEMSDDDLAVCLNDGVEICDADGMSIKAAEEAIMQRLRIEKTIRVYNLRR